VIRGVSTLVSSFLTTTAAPGTAPPCWSVTVPCTLPRSIEAQSQAAGASAIRTVAKRPRIRLHVITPSWTPIPVPTLSIQSETQVICCAPTPNAKTPRQAIIDQSERILVMSSANVKKRSTALTAVGPVPPRRRRCLLEIGAQSDLRLTGGKRNRLMLGAEFLPDAPIQLHPRHPLPLRMSQAQHNFGRPVTLGK